MNARLVLAAVALLGLPCTRSSLTGYDCAEAEVLNTVQSSDIITQCTSIPIPATRTIPVEIYEIKGPKTVVGYRCQIRYKQSLVDWRGTKRALPLGTVFIGRDACLKAHKFGYMDLEDRVPNLDPHGTTHYSLRTVYPDVKFNQAHFIPGYHDHYYERDYDITLSQHSGLIGFQENLIHFDNDIYCDFSNFSCVDDSVGEIAWTADLQQKFSSSSIFGGNITLVTVNETLIIPKRTYAVMQVMLDLISFRVIENVTVSGRVVFRTDHPDLYIEPITKLKLGWSHFRAPKLYEYINLTRSYSSRYDPMVAPNVIGHLVAKSFCLKDSLDMINHCNNSSGTFAVGCAVSLSKPGIMGITHFGSTIAVQKCQRQVVQTRETDQCYSNIPVIDESHQKRFLEPLFRVLTDVAKPIVCDTNKTSNSHELVKDSNALQSTDDDSKKSKGSTLPDWALVILIVFVCVWGIFGITKLAQLIISIIKKREYLLSCDDGRFSINSSWSTLKRKFPWIRRVRVQEETELNVRFSG